MTDQVLRKKVQRLEEELRTLRAMQAAPYRAVVEDMTELIVRWRPDGTRVFVNDSYCSMFGITREQAIGSSFWPLITEQDREQVRRRIEQLSPEQPVSTGRHQATQPDGSLIWMEWTDRALFDENRDILEYQSVGRDVTERVLQEEQLRRLEQADAIAKHSAGLAHDLRSVLQVIRMNAELFAEDCQGNEEMGELVAAVDRGQALVEQLQNLRYGRVLKPTRFDLNERINHALALLREVAGRHARVQMVLHRNPCPISGDPTQLDQVLLNLVRNAAEAGAETIRVSTERDGVTRLRVLDDAKGIPEAILPRIFEPHISTKAEGQGLGLATVRAIVEAHQATIDVDTSRYGTTFEVCFPGA